MKLEQKTSAIGQQHLFTKRYAQLAYEVKKYDAAGPMVISGVANAAAPDRINDIIPASAWMLDDYAKNPVVCLNHNYDEPIGISTSFEATDAGLVCECLIGDPSAGYELTEGQKKARSLLAQKILRAFSVGFIPLEIDYDPDTESVTILKALLLEISVVTVPCQQDSLISTVKSLGVTTMAQAQAGTQTKQEPVVAPTEGGVTLEKLAEEIKGCSGKLDKIIGLLDKPSEKPEGATPMEESLAQANARIKELEEVLADVEKTL